MQYREKWDEQSCGIPNCSHEHERLKIQPVCHPGSSVVVQYVFHIHALSIACASCGAGVALVPVESISQVEGGGAETVERIEAPPPVIQDMRPAAKAKRQGSPGKKRMP